MSTAVVAAVLLAAACHAGWNTLVKGRGADPWAASFGLSATWVALGVPLLWAVPPLEPAAVPLLAASVAVHVVYFGLLTAAYGTGELSLVYPIARGVPPLAVAIASALLGEGLGAVGLLGVVAITLGVVVLTPPPGVGGPRSVPILLALGSAACTATYTLLDGYGTRLGGGPTPYLTRLVAYQGGAFVAVALAWRGPAVARAAWANGRASVGAGLLSALGYGVALWAMTQAPIAAVAALRESSVPMAAVLGAVVLRERLDARRVAATALVGLGAVSLRLAG